MGKEIFWARGDDWKEVHAGRLAAGTEGWKQVVWEPGNYPVLQFGSDSAGLVVRESQAGATCRTDGGTRENGAKRLVRSCRPDPRKILRA